MMHKAWRSIEEVPIVFQGHPSNFMVTRVNKSPILTRIVRFRTVTLVWIHRWLWNEAHSLKQHRRGVLLFFEVIHQISRSHGTKNRRFWPEMSVSGLQLQFEFADGFEMKHKVWYSIEEVPCSFSRSSIKFKGHKGQKKLDPTWAFPDINSSLNSPRGLRWCKKLDVM